MRKPDDNRSASTHTLSAAPSLSSSRPSINNSKLSLGSHCSQHSHHSQNSHNSQNSQNSQASHKSNETLAPPTREEIIAAYLEKAKFYTSLCLGKYLNR